MSPHTKFEVTEASQAIFKHHVIRIAEPKAVKGLERAFRASENHSHQVADDKVFGPENMSLQLLCLVESGVDVLNQHGLLMLRQDSEYLSCVLVEIVHFVIEAGRNASRRLAAVVPGVDDVEVLWISG